MRFESRFEKTTNDGLSFHTLHERYLRVGLTYHADTSPSSKAGRVSWAESENIET